MNATKYWGRSYLSAAEEHLTILILLGSIGMTLGSSAWEDPKSGETLPRTFPPGLNPSKRMKLDDTIPTS